MYISENNQLQIFESIFPIEFIQIDKELQAIDAFLNKNSGIIETFGSVLKERFPHSRTLGRHSKPAESIFRILILRRLYSLSFRDVHKQVSDSLILRKFTRTYHRDVPHYSTLAKYDILLDDEVLKQINEHIVRGAVKKKITRGRRLRIDTTVVDGSIHHPTDSSLLYDGIRVLSRLKERCRRKGIAQGEVTRNFTRSAKKQLLYTIKHVKSRKKEREQLIKNTHEKLIQIAKRNICHARKLIKIIGDSPDKEAMHIKKKLAHYVPLVNQVVNQTKKQLFAGEKVDNRKKLISIFQPDLYVLRKGNYHRRNQFGKLFELHQTEGKVISHWDVWSENQADTSLMIPAAERHKEMFGKMPHLAAVDRGFYSHENERTVKELGVKCVCVPYKGKKTAERRQYEKKHWFRKGQRFRAGIEGTISVLKRRHGLNRCLNTGKMAFERWVGLGVISYNLMVIASG
jgi:IS5 family transposase